MKTIVLCADDYGQAPTISDGILALLAKKRLSAVSCMVNTPYWPAYAGKLVAYQQAADIGLHFNLTEGQPLSGEFKNGFDGLGKLIIKAHAYGLRREAIAAELHAQIDAFQQATGLLPQFLDGHQHIHHLPVIRDVVIDIYNKRLKQPGSYMRLVKMPLSVADVFSKKMVIYLTGVIPFKRLLEKHAIAHNSNFSGIYNFANAKQYPAYFRGFLQEIEQGGLIMCHPGKESDNTSDEIAYARSFEYDYFLGDQFERDCIEQKVVFKRFI